MLSNLVLSLQSADFAVRLRKTIEWLGAMAQETSVTLLGEGWLEIPESGETDFLQESNINTHSSTFHVKMICNAKQSVFDGHI